MKCRLCGESFVKDKIGKKAFCHPSCRDKFHRLSHCKEYFKLSEEDKLLREKVLAYLEMKK